MESSPSIPELGAARTLAHLTEELRRVILILESHPPDPVRAQILAAARSAYRTLQTIAPLLPTEVRPPG